MNMLHKVKPHDPGRVDLPRDEWQQLATKILLLIGPPVSTEHVEVCDAHIRKFHDTLTILHLSEIGIVYAHWEHEIFRMQGAVDEHGQA